MGTRNKPEGIERSGRCRICLTRGVTEWHHIISHRRCLRIGREDLLTNPGNLVELCRPCHSQTAASLVRELMAEESQSEQRTPSGHRKIQRKFRCFRCGSFEHLVPECRAERDVDGDHINRMWENNHWLVKRHGIACFRCGRTGHRWRSCKERVHVDGRHLPTGT